jgi:hypothetical protein
VVRLHGRLPQFTPPQPKNAAKNISKLLT